MQFFFFFLKNSNVNLNTLAILAKSSIWGAWLGLACASADGYNTAFKIQVEISLWQQVKMDSFWSLGQLIVFLFFLSGFLFYEHSPFGGQQGKGEAFSLTLFYHFHQLHRHLEISRAIIAESSPLHITCSRTRTKKLRAQA